MESPLLFIPPELTEQQINENKARRRRWAKFGDCAGQMQGYIEPGITVASSREIPFEFPGTTTKTPKNRIIVQQGDILLEWKPKTQEERNNESASTSSSQSAKPQRSSYVPPHLRSASSSSSSNNSSNSNHHHHNHQQQHHQHQHHQHQQNGFSNNHNHNHHSKGHRSYSHQHQQHQHHHHHQQSDTSGYTICIYNLSEDVEEIDVKDLVRCFGRWKKVFVQKDKRTGLCRGRAFVTFEHEESAIAAIQTLDGHPYSYQLLRADWAKPRETY